MAQEDFTSFTKEALLAILHELGVDFPSADLSVTELAQIVADSESAVGAKNFAAAVAKANGLQVAPTKSPSKEVHISSAVIADDGKNKLVRTWIPDRNLDSGIGDVEIISDTFDPPSSTYHNNC
jgi:hypothetical protein